MSWKWLSISYIISCVFLHVCIPLFLWVYEESREVAWGCLCSIFGLSLRAFVYEYRVCVCVWCVCVCVQKLVSLQSSGVGMNSSSADGFTPLHVAALHGRGALVSLLIRHGANINARNSQGVTPLHLACQNSHMQVRSGTTTAHTHSSTGMSTSLFSQQNTLGSALRTLL